MWTSPERTSIDTSSNARTPGNDFEIFRISRINYPLLIQEGWPDSQQAGGPGWSRVTKRFGLIKPAFTRPPGKKRHTIVRILGCQRARKKGGKGLPSSPFVVLRRGTGI